MSNTTVQSIISGPQYDAWLGYLQSQSAVKGAAKKTAPVWSHTVTVAEDQEIISTASAELTQGLDKLFGIKPKVNQETVSQVSKSDSAHQEAQGIWLGTWTGSEAVAQAFSDTERSTVQGEGYIIREDKEQGRLFIGSETPQGVLYGTFHLLRELVLEQENSNEVHPAEVRLSYISEQPVNALRMINQWDNVDGSIERGYAGKSIFYDNGEFTRDLGRIRDYARLLASTGLNAISINNVNVHQRESLFLTERFLGDVAKVAAQFRAYGIRLFLSANYASPIEIGGLLTADPLDEQVREWWNIQTAKVYAAIPDFGGYLIKADSENRPGPFTYNRDHADGANMLAEALRPFGGLVIWRCFVYNCKQDWRDRSTDRARAAYDHGRHMT
ncbi:alpha-glucuronidase family glycosyl hydrolase, partial [Paenibacillus tundrae]|uniref:alpha-glucuronidase family glycosyl hydrolase n=1 Tax=Paenibacillus tundrae TaxID=528187 RepID=UPI0022A8F940